MDQHLQTTSPKRRWLRRGLFAVLFTVGVLGVVLWTVTRSWFLIAQVQPALAERLGGDVSISTAAYEGGGRFVFRDVVLRVPSHSGEAGEVLRVTYARVQVDERRLFQGGIQLRDIELDGVLLRLAEDENDGGTFTFMDLAPQWDDDDADAVAELPRLEIRNAVVEYGTHGERGYLASGRRRLAGLMEPDIAAGRAYNLRLFELDAAGEQLDDGISVEGQWNVESNENEATIRGLDLDRASYDMVPQAVRWWWDNLGLEGRLANARFEWREGRPLSIVFDIENVGITLPVETDELWARYHAGEVIPHSARPRLRVRSGTIRFEDNAIKLDDLVGELRSEDVLDGGSDPSHSAVGVPYEVRVSIRDLRPVDWDDREAWMNQMLVTVPFDMEFSVTDFAITPDEAGNLPPVDLPLPIAQALQLFRLTDFRLTTRVLVARDAEGSLVTRGEVHVSDASGAYIEFPYPLSDIDTTISFVNERVTIESLRGRAPSGAQVSIAGTINTLGRDAEVDLRLTTERVAVDEHLRAAMRFKSLGFFDAILSTRAEEALRASGRMDAGLHIPFELGGEVALELRIYRAFGPKQPTHVTGSIHIHSVGMVYEHFPYPFVMTGGSLLLAPDGVSTIDDEHGRGVPIRTAGGGSGYVRGEVRTQRVDGVLKALPDMMIEVENDRMNPLITAAIPPGDRDEAFPEWPEGEVSKPVALLESAGLSGLLSYAGRIDSDEAGNVRWDFSMDLRGTSQPGAELAATLSDAGLVWPPDLLISDLEAQVRVTNEEITLTRFDGHHEHGLIGATGHINWFDDVTRTALDIELIDLKLDRDLIEILPVATAEAVERFWDRYRPSGTFNAKLEVRARGEDVEPPRLWIDPTGAQVHIEGEPVLLERKSGELLLADGRLSLTDLVVAFLRKGGEISDGSALVSGYFGLATAEEDRAMEIQAQWTGARFESPIVVEAVRLVGAEGQFREFERLNPRGLFHADFRYESAPNQQPASYRLSLQPRTLLLDLDETTLEADLHETSLLTLDDRGIEIHSLNGVLDGNAFSLAGTIGTGPRARIALTDIAFDGRLMNEQVQSILPQNVRDLLNSINFVDGPRTVIEGGRLTLSRAEQCGERAGEWDSSFAGVLRTTGASFSAGLNVSQFDGTTTIRYDDGSGYEGSASPRLEIDVHGESLLLANRRFTNVTATGLTLSNDGRTLYVPEVRAESYGGLLWAQVNVGLVDGEPYDARVELVGASVSGLMTPEAEANRAARPRRQGIVNAGVRVSGLAGDPETRVGRGVIRAVGGSIESVPLLLQLMQVLQLSLPLRGALDNAHIELLIDGDTAIFERILLESTVGDVANLQLFGEGEMNLRTLDLRTHFRSRGGTLIIRDLVGGIGDQLYGIEIVGTLLNPRARVVPLPGLTQHSATRLRAQPRRAAAIASGQAR